MIWEALSIQFKIPMFSDVLLKITLFFSLGWIIHFMFIKQNPRWRVLLWRGVVCGTLLIPVLIRVVPAYQISVPVNAGLQEPLQRIIEEPPFLFFMNEQDTSSSIKRAGTFSESNFETNHSTIQSEPVGVSKADHENGGWNASWFFYAWGIVTLILILRLFRGMYIVRNIVKQSLLAPETCQNIIRRVAEEIGCRERSLLRCSREVAAPYLCGFIHPVILLPERMIQEDYQKELPGIIAHELAHLNSKDIWWMAVIQWLQTFLWFHPLVWRINNVHDAACEAISDAVAANYIGNMKSYSITLARVALQISDIPPIYGGINMTRKSEIRRRLEFLRNRIDVSPLLRNRVVMFLFLALLGLVCITGLHPLLLIGEELGDNNVIGDPTSIEQSSGSKKMPFNASSTLRQINCYTPDYDWWVGKKLLFEDGTISEDGKYLAFTDNGDYLASSPRPGRKLGILNIETNEMFSVIDTSSSGYISKPRLSPNNQLIAYRVVDATSYQVWIGNKESGVHSKIIEKMHSEGIYSFIEILGWSADNKQIYTYGLEQKKENEYQVLLGVISLDTKKYEKLRTSDQPFLYPFNAYLSPNRQFIAYDTYHRINENEISKSDIYIVDLKSSKESMVVEHSAYDHVLGWSHDGKWLLFKSDRSGTWDLWGLPMDQGEPQRAPVRIKRNIGDIQSLGMSDSDSLYYKNEFGTKELYLADFDINTGISFDSMIPLGQGLNESMLSWHDISLDGKYLAFNSMKLGVIAKKTYVQSLETMEIKEVEHNLNNPLCLTWSNDNKFIYAKPWEQGIGPCICRIDTESGEHELIKELEENIKDYLVLRSDKKYLYYLVFLKDQDFPNLIQYDPITKIEKIILSNANFEYYMISPNGKYLALGYEDKQQVITVEGGKLVKEWNLPPSRAWIEWLPDNEHFISPTQKPESFNDRQLLLFSIHEDEPNVIQTFDAPLHRYRMHPDGDKIVIEVGDNLIQEFWVMENFLP